METLFEELDSLEFKGDFDSLVEGYQRHTEHFGKRMLNLRSDITKHLKKSIEYGLKRNGAKETKYLEKAVQSESLLKTLAEQVKISFDLKEIEEDAFRYMDSACVRVYMLRESQGNLALSSMEGDTEEVNNSIAVIEGLSKIIGIPERVAEERIKDILLHPGNYLVY